MVPRVLHRSSVPQGPGQKSLRGLAQFLRRRGFVGLLGKGEFGSVLPVEAKASSAFWGKGPRPETLEHPSRVSTTCPAGTNTRHVGKKKSH